MKFICPLIVVEDIERSRRFYGEILGLRVKADYGENLTFEGDFAIHQREHFETLLDGAQVIRKSNSTELYFEEDELEPLVERLKADGCEFAHPLREQPWRQRVVRFYDHDGNLIEIGESLEHTAWRLSLEGMPVEEICRITYLPEQTVRKAVEYFGEE